MSRTLPLSYVRPVTGTVAPGGFLTCAGGRGDVGQWVSDPSAELIDPSANNTVTTLAAKHNELVWLYGLTRILTVAPRMYFGEAGNYGIQFYRNDIPILLMPLPVMTLSYPSLSMSDALTELNTMLGSNPSEAEFVYDGQRINLVFKPQTSPINWKLRERTGSYYGAAKRMLNRIFNRTDADTTLLAEDISFNSPALIQGAPLTGPIVGIYPVPAAVTGLQVTGKTLTEFTVEWTASSDVSGYYVYVKEGSNFNKSWYVPAPTTSKLLGTSDGLQASTQYTITVVATTPYEISVGNPSVSDYFGPPPSTEFDVYAAANSVGGITPFLFSVNSTTITPFPIIKVLDMPAAAWPADLTDTTQITGLRYTAYAERNTGIFTAAAEFLLQGAYDQHTVYFSYDNTVQKKYVGSDPNAISGFVGIGTCAELGTDPAWNNSPWVTNATRTSFTITNPTWIRDFFGTENPQGIFSTTIDKTRGIQAFWKISYTAWYITNCECTEFVIIYNPAP